MLPDLLENDGSVRPEMATAIYAHLAVCPGCSREYDQMQRVIARIEALPPAEMPMDFSGVIMRRIQEQAETVHSSRAVTRQQATTSPHGKSGARATVTVARSARSQTGVQTTVTRMTSGTQSHTVSQQTWTGR